MAIQEFFNSMLRQATFSLVLWIKLKQKRMIKMHTKNDNKHLTNIVKKVKVRPVLRGIHYNSDTQKIIACDSHRLLQIKSIETIPLSFTIDYDSNQLLTQEYPNTQRLIPTNGIELILQSDIITKEFLQTLKSFKEQTISFKVSNNHIEFLSPSNYTFYRLQLTNGDDTDLMYMNAKYIYDVLLYIFELPTHKVTVLFPESVIRPLLFKNEFYEYLITPIRNQN